MNRVSYGCIAAVIAAGLLCIAALDALAGSCALQSPAHRVSVLELYTSEGCNSCPPADRWFSALAQQGVTSQNAVLLAFHVDYWNQLGWPDRFSESRYSQRQREVASRASKGVVYTPQILLDGRDLRLNYSIEQLRSTLDAINQEPGQARIDAQVLLSADALRITAMLGRVAPRPRQRARELQRDGLDRHRGAQPVVGHHHRRSGGHQRLNFPGHLEWQDGTLG